MKPSSIKEIINKAILKEQNAITAIQNCLPQTRDEGNIFCYRTAKYTIYGHRAAIKALEEGIK